MDGEGNQGVATGLWYGYHDAWYGYHCGAGCPYCTGLHELWSCSAIELTSLRSKSSSELMLSGLE